MLTRIVMIHPEHSSKVLWDYFVLAVVLGAALAIPITVVFESSSREISSGISILVSIVLAIDILLAFNTTYFAQGTEITDRRSAAQKYLRSWFMVDLVAAIPIGAIIVALPLPDVLLLRLLSLLPLIRLSHVGSALGRIGGTNFNPAILRLFLLFLWISVGFRL